MKKFVCLIAAIILLSTVSAAAKNGDVKQPYFTTDILTYMDGIPIQTWSLNGRMLIALEDLESYGFSVSYDESIRTLFVNKTNEPYEDFHPVYERGKEGEIAGYTYETDIEAYVNGTYIPTESINGKLLAVAEDLGRVVNENDDYMLWIHSWGGESTVSAQAYEKYGKYGVSHYFMSHVWDAENRVLNIYNTTGTLPSYEERIQAIKDEHSFTAYETFENQYGTLLFCDGDAVFVWKNGAYTNLYDIFAKYDMTHLSGIPMKNCEFSDDGLFMYFDSGKERAEPPYYHQFVRYDEGRYCLDLKNFIITKLT